MSRLTQGFVKWYSVDFAKIFVGSTIFGFGGGVTVAICDVQRQDSITFSKCVCAGGAGAVIGGLMGPPIYYMTPIAFPATLVAKAYSRFFQ
jgi:hypothetical protein